MDTSIRSAQRSGDPLAYALTLRRAGHLDATLRVLRDATRAGVSGAGDALEQLAPFQPRSERLGAVLARVGGDPTLLLGVLGEVAGMLDPRLDPLVLRAIEAHRPPHHGAERLRRALDPELAVGERWRLLLQASGTRSLARACLWSHEATPLAARLAAQSAPPSRADAQRAHRLGAQCCALWLAGAYAEPGEAQRLIEVARRDPAARVRLAAQQAAHELGEDAPDDVHDGMPGVPPWAPSAWGPWRDPQSGAWDRSWLLRQWRGSEPSWLGPADEGAPPLEGAAWALLLELDGFEALARTHGFFYASLALERVAAAWPAVVGDRLFQLSRQILVLWEGESPRALAEALQARAAELRFEVDDQRVDLSVSVGIAAGGPFDEVFPRVSQALDQARQGGNRGGVFQD